MDCLWTIEGEFWGMSMYAKISNSQPYSPRYWLDYKTVLAFSLNFTSRYYSTILIFNISTIYGLACLNISWAAR